MIKERNSSFITILKNAYKAGGNLQITYRIKNGKIVDLDFFQLLSNLGEDETLEAISKTKTKLVIEIEHSGVKKMIEGFEKLKESVKV